MESCSIAIVGGGIAGLSTAWQLARRGARGVVLLERERELGRHSTGLNAAILRTALLDPFTESLARETAGLLLQPPPGFAERPLVERCGVVICGTARGSQGTALERRLEARADAERLTPERLRALAPHLEPRADAAWFLRDDGRIEIEALVQAFAHGARDLGVRIETGADVRALLVRDGVLGGVRLADGREVRAETTLIAAGGWAARLAAGAGSRVRLRPTRRHLLVSTPDVRVDPRWPVVWSDADPFYARPAAGGLMLCACDEVDVDPDALAALPSERAAIVRKAARHLPRFAGMSAARFWAGVRTLSADARFAIGPDPDVASLAWVGALGGNGMECCFSIGRLGAAALLGDGSASAQELAAVAPARLVAEEPLRARHES